MHENPTSDPAEIHDLCIVGTGIAGLNALHAARQYLPTEARVALVDRREGPGGMWTNTYDYVRLHQPFEMFTAGDIAWRLDRPRDYLATGAEVRAHLDHCCDTLVSGMSLTRLFGYEAGPCEEEHTKHGVVGRVTCRPVSGDGEAVTVRARRLINATALDVPVPPSLDLSSCDVVSTTPHELRATGQLDSAMPAFVIGGGKTGMDTVLALRAARPDRPITLINGKGTVFANRDRFLPRGVGRWWRGQLLLKTFGDLAMRFNGRNAREVFDYFHETYAISPDGRGVQFFFGLMSEAENAAVAQAVERIMPGYLSDVVDAPAGPEMVLRDGSRHSIAPGSVFINCTGHLLRNDPPDTTCLSPNGACLSISSRSAVHFLPSVATYFLTHLYFRDALRDSGVYEIDLARLFREDRQAWNMTAVTQSFLNTIRIVDALPMGVVNGCGLDLDRWFPLPRRALGMLDLKVNRRRYLDHCRRALDTVGADHQIRCGPI
ncbi:MAG: NAD(P)-binding protein [Roseovarius sp.]|nr:NAD(P)-binding protein [Roseovarius sp.]